VRLADAVAPVERLKLLAGGGKDVEQEDVVRLYT